MRIAVSLLITFVGAVVLWAVNATVVDESLNVIGIILIAAGVIGLIPGLVALVSREIARPKHP